MTGTAGGHRTPTTITGLPFRERPVLELLHLTGDRDVPDPDYAGFGHARVPRLVLASRAGRDLIDDALILALHSADDGAPLPDDLELEFVLDGGSALVRLSDFLPRWLPRLRRDERAIVLAMCNPHRAAIARPAAAAGVPLHYAIGDVESWLDDDLIRLSADAWHRV
jgi:hypothetical protein